jgi:hypothetical protein
MNKNICITITVFRVRTNAGSDGVLPYRSAPVTL